MPENTFPKAKAGYVALVGDMDKLKPIRGVLDFFKVPSRVDRESLRERILTISYGDFPSALDHVSEPLLCIPSDTKRFHRFLTRVNVEAISMESQQRLNIRVRGLASLDFQVSKIYCFRGPIEKVICVRRVPLIARVTGTQIHLLSVNIADEINQLLNDRMDLKPSLRFRIYSRLPFDSLAPKETGNKLLRLMAHANFSADTCLRHLNSLDGLRYLLLGAIAISSGRTVSTLWFWPKNVKYVITITHDVDTRYGFQEGADLLRRVERKYKVKTAWNIPVRHYQIETKAVKALAWEDCEIGLHGYRHDGRLIFATGNEIAKELVEARELLTKVSGRQVRGFRAPLLQHSKKILQATEEAGFIYDSSIPAWEAYCRTSEKAHGIGTIYPFMVSDRFVEIPVTLPQDHQLMHVGGLSSREVLELWKTLMEHIKSFGGLCSVIIHPERDLFGRGRMLRWYEKFIREITGDSDCWLTLPSNVAKWWLLRSKIALTPHGEYVFPPKTGDQGKDTVLSDEPYERDGRLGDIIKIVEYEQDDFLFQ